MRDPKQSMLPVLDQGSVNRRAACQLLGGTAGGVLLTSCGGTYTGGTPPGSGMGSTVPGAGKDMGLPDLRGQDLRSADLRSADLRSSDLANVDLRPPPVSDMGTGCPATGIDTGKTRTQFAVNTATFFPAGLKPSFYVCRDAGGLFAMSAVCTHLGCLAQYPGSGMVLTCPCHGSQFDLTGTVLKGPAAVALVHYQICISTQGKVIVDHTVVSSTLRY